MAINKNHEFEELDGIKCAIVERNVSQERALFLKDILVQNGYTVVLVPSPPPKAAKPTKPAADEAVTVPEATPPAPETFTIGVTDLMFNPINAIFGRKLKTKKGQAITLAYWEQRDIVSRDDIPYYADTPLVN